MQPPPPQGNPYPAHIYPPLPHGAPGPLHAPSPAMPPGASLAPPPGGLSVAGSPLVSPRPSPRPSPTNTEAVRFPSSRDEEKMLGNLADLYSIIVSVEHLEKMYIRGAVPSDQYTQACSNLIALYRTASEIVRDAVPDLTFFLAEYNVRCPAACNRLRVGVPATIMHGDGFETERKQTEAHIAEAVHHFLTTMDSLKLKMTAVDQIQPLLRDLVETLNKIPALAVDEQIKSRLQTWLPLLNRMRASDVLDDDQVRQLTFDLSTSYSSFHATLANAHK